MLPGYMRELVPSGSFLASKRKEGSLVALLGTCVGIAIRDSEAGVGGLVHLLLPEPEGEGMFWQPAIYARTGLPLFLEALYGEGAKRERMEACIAGGALVGPLSRGDLRLDIGGRTADIAEMILRSEKIPLLNRETGGYFSCSLTLDLRSLEWEIDPFGATEQGGPENFKKPGREDILSSLDHIQPIPQIGLKVIRMIGSGAARFGEIAKELAKDQVLSAKLIRLCNSALFSPRQTIDTLDRALLTLGDLKLLELLVSACLEDLLTGKTHGYSICKGGLFSHSVGAATVARRLAEIAGGLSADLSYTAALLHDIGKIVLDQFLASSFPMFYRKTQVEKVSLLEVEKETFGISHTEAGALLAERWSLPRNLSEVIARHHSPGESKTASPLVHLAYVADIITSRFMPGQQLSNADSDLLSSSLRALAFDPARFPSLVEHVLQGSFGNSSLVSRQ